MSEQRKYDSTVARIAGNILSGSDQTAFGWKPAGDPLTTENREAVQWAVAMARAVVAEVKRTEAPAPPQDGQ